MNTYIVTYVDEHDNIRAEQVESYNAAAACYDVDCRLEDIISVMRIYNRMEETY
jgi:hypothetical protein